MCFVLLIFSTLIVLLLLLPMLKTQKSSNEKKIAFLASLNNTECMASLAGVEP